MAIWTRYFRKILFTILFIFVVTGLSEATYKLNSRTGKWDYYEGGLTSSSSPLSLSGGVAYYDGYEIVNTNTDVSGAGGGTGASTDNFYLVTALEGDLTSERVLTVSNPLTYVDGGAQGNFTISIVDNGIGAGQLGVDSVSASELNATGVETELEAVIDHDDLQGFVANEHIDWTSDQGATNIDAGNYTDTDTTYSAGTGMSLAGTTFNCTVTDTDTTNASGINVLSLSGATYGTVQDWVNTTQSAGKISGGTISDDGDGTVTVASGTGFIKTTDSDVGVSKFFDWSASSALSLTNDSSNYIYVDYNSGTPQLAVATSIPSDHNTKVLLGMLYKEDSDLHIVSAGQLAANFANKIFWKSITIYGKFQHGSGMAIGETGTRNITMTAGKVYAGLTATSIGAVDTSSGDTFTYVYRDGSGGFTEVTGQTQIDNTHYDDGDGTLHTTINGKYVCHWVYADIDGHIYVVYGTNDQNLTRVQKQTAPSDIPTRLTEVGGLIGRIIIEKDASSFELVESAFGTKFVPSVVGEHGDLSGLQGGTADEYYHLTDSEHTELNGWLDDVTLGSDGSINTPKDLIVDTDTLYVDASTHRIGIGTDSPDQLVQIVGSTPRMEFDDTSGGADWSLRNGAGTFDIIEDGIAVQGSFVEGGDFGLGTETPRAKLDVRGDAVINEGLSIGGTSEIFIYNDGHDAVIEGEYDIIVKPQSGELQFDDPGIGNTSTLRFNKTSDAASIQVTETESDKTTYQFNMKDNPDSSDDKFEWFIEDYEGDHGDWKPLLFSGLDITFQASDYIVNGRTEFNADSFYSANGVANTIIEDKTGTTSITLDVSGYDRESDVYTIEIDGDGTPDTYQYTRGSTSFMPLVAEDVPITGSKQLLGNGIYITFDSTTNANLSDTYQFRVWKGGYFKVDTDTLYVDSVNDRVGIGTDSPDDTLQILPISGEGITLRESDNGNSAIKLRAWGASSDIELFKSGIKKIQINSDGVTYINTGKNVGIGTSNPEETLDVNGGVKIANDLTVIGDAKVADEIYGAGWNGSTEVPTKNAVYDKIQTISGSSPWTTTTDGAYLDGDVSVTGTLQAGTHIYSSGNYWSKEINNPDRIQAIHDAIPIFHVEAEAFPQGITITDCGIKNLSSSAYTVVFEEWTDMTTHSSDIETISKSVGNYEAEDNGTIDDGSISAGNIVFVDLPTTDVDWLTVWFVYRKEE